MGMLIKNISPPHIEREAEHKLPVGIRPIGDGETSFMTFDERAHKNEPKSRSGGKNCEEVNKSARAARIHCAHSNTKEGFWV